VLKTFSCRRQDTPTGGPGGTVISITGSDDLHTIVVLNPKGGCGKTTLATNLAACYALRQLSPTLIDCDPQGFSTGWLEKRPEGRPKIYALRGFGECFDASGQRLEVPLDSRIAIVDLPAAIRYDRLHEYTHIADSLLLLIQPSEIDVYSATRFIAELLLDVRLDRHERRLAIVANRVRSNTKSYRSLLRFLSSLRIPMIAALRDSQNYVYAAAQGIGVCELPAFRARDDIPGISAVTRWLDDRRAVTERQRQAMIARAAYRLAECRGFESGDPVQDWLDAEREVDADLAADPLAKSSGVGV
jgi:chromosome partitioning protein